MKLGFGFPTTSICTRCLQKSRKKIKSLPRTLDEALDALEADHEFLLKGGVFPKRLLEDSV